MPLERLRSQLDRLYARYNRRELVHPDPLEFLYDYPDLEQREIVGLIASSLAYGRVNQILKSVGHVLGVLGPAPRDFIMAGEREGFSSAFAGFKHRFNTGDDVAGLLEGIRVVIQRHGTLGEFFSSCFTQGHGDICKALISFVHDIRDAGRISSSFLLPSPEKKSACKRLFLYLRWMVREDDVDPGGWVHIPPSALVVPLDTHMHHISQALGFTGRKQADLKAALEITEHFRAVEPDDPVKYDFALTRFGIREELDRLSVPDHVTPIG